MYAQFTAHYSLQVLECSSKLGITFPWYAVTLVRYLMLPRIYDYTRSAEELMKELKECLNVPWSLSSFSTYCKAKDVFLLIKTQLRSVTRKDRSFAAHSWLAVLDLAQKSDMMDLERTLMGFLGTQSVEDLLEAGLNPSPLIDLLHEVSTPDATVRYILIQRVIGSIL